MQWDITDMMKRLSVFYAATHGLRACHAVNSTHQETPHLLQYPDYRPMSSDTAWAEHATERERDWALQSHDPETGRALLQEIIDHRRSNRDMKV